VNSETATAQRELNVHTLVGHGQIALAARCLGSLVRAHHEPVHVIVHDDGSVTPEDMAQFRETVPHSSVVLRGDADECVNDFLAKYPACKRLRDTSVYGLKIFDLQVLEAGENIAYADSDILFLKPVAGLFEMPPDPRSGGAFMRDPQQAYCLRSVQLLTTPKLKLGDRVNAGLFYFRRSAFDWDLVEWFLSHDNFAVHPYWKEQTSWSVLAADANCWIWNEEQVKIVRTASDLNDKLAVAHFISTYRKLMEKAPAFDDKLSPTQITCLPGGQCSFLDLFRDELARKRLRFGK